MDLDATFLLSLATLAAAAIAVGVSGWVLFLRDRRAATAATTGDDGHHAEDS